MASEYDELLTKVRELGARNAELFDNGQMGSAEYTNNRIAYLNIRSKYERGSMAWEAVSQNYNDAFDSF